MTDFAIPTIDLSPFFNEGPGDENRHKKEAVMEVIQRACSKYWFFQIVNHGMPMELMDWALALSRAFFECPNEEKMKFSPSAGAPLPAGYSKQPDHSPDKNEYLLMFPSGSSFNVYPKNPPELREVLEQVFSYMVRTGSFLEGILNECLGLPPNFLKGYSADRSWDFMVALRYFMVRTGSLQDDVEVLSNNKFKSATHRVVRSKGRSRQSYAFFYNLQGDKLVEPLPQFTSDIGEPPKYRPFLYKEYQQLRLRNKTHPPSRPEDVIHVTHYAIHTAL